MKLQTQIPLKKGGNPIDYESCLLLLGSCFVENMGRKLDYFKFQNLQNPFGILFHPYAIENLVERAIQKRSYTAKEVFFLNERWHCYDAHSDLSDTSRESLLEKLNKGLEKTLQQIHKSTHILVTLGTSWVYRHFDSDRIVANCHKVPQKKFSKELLSVKAIEKSLLSTIQHIRSINENAQFIFTISPVRHLKDGFNENQRSKAHLTAAVHKIFDVPSFGARELFPSYELMMDELRDYRFYEPDMVHPNQLAIDYIWEKFKQTWISEEAYPIMSKVDNIQKGLRHRPFDPDSGQHRKFRESLEANISNLKKEYPFMEF